MTIIRFTLYTLSCLLLVTVNSYCQLNRSIETSPAGTEYYLYLPNDYDGTSSYPMLVYLHGAQALGNSINCSFGKGLAGAINQNRSDVFDTLQMIIIAPHVQVGSDCSYADNDYEWDPAFIDEVVQDAINNNNIDSDRIFGSGISLGAKGIWDYALQYPLKLAGLVPISGNAPLDDLCTLTQTAVWAFHGESDGLIAISGGDDRKGPETIIETINTCNPSPYLPAYLTTFKGKGHNGWDQVYDLSAGYNIYEWLLSLKRNVSSDYDPLVELGPNYTIMHSTDLVKINSFVLDPNGNITTYNWTQNSGPALTFSNGNDHLDISNLPAQEATYEFKLEVTDNEGNQKSDSVTLNVVMSNTSPIVTALHLYDGASDTDLGPITNGQVVNMNSYDMELIDIVAAVDNMNSRASVRFALNENHNFTSLNENKISSVYSIGQNNHKSFNPGEGQYTIRATAYGDRNGLDPGISHQVTLSFTESPLPVTIMDFKASKKQNHVLVSWTTTSEINNSHFELYQGIGSPSDFKKISIVNKSSSEESVKSYEHMEYSPPCGKLYYQLVNIDYDNHKDFSEIISIENNTCDLRVYPNPTKNGQFNISGRDIKGIEFKLYSLDGQLISNFKLSGNHQAIDVTDLIPGLYFLRYSNNIMKIVISQNNEY
ncbi:MAG: T9SS type A sorting domain-containing protein [Fulvivirga sp.]